MKVARARLLDTCRRGTRVLVAAAALALSSVALPGNAVLAANASAPASRANANAAPVAMKASANVEFNISMLSGSSRDAIDLSRFEKGITVMPGIYNVDVYLNQQWIGRMNVRFAAPKPHANARPCVSAAMIGRMRLQAQVSDRADAKLARPGACVQLGDLIAGARMQFAMSDLRLNATVPQAMMGDKPRGYVAPASWDAGIPAFLLNYRFNAYRSHSDGLGQTSAYLGLDAGLNIGPWRLRQRSTVTWLSGMDGAPAQRQWHNIDVYARRAIPALKAELTLGDSHTDGAVFNSFALRGVQLSTDDRMRPQSRRGYAPVVRGVAATNAKVTIRQNGIEIYQTTVPPGPFVINDLYPTGYGGSLEVTVTEADGHQHTYAVPYASVAQLVRPGVTRFNLDVGQLRNTPFGSHPRVIQGAIQHGFDNRITGYAGFQGSAGYAAALIGGAINTRIGALAMDITEAGITLPGLPSHTGHSVRLTWSKILPTTRTSFSVAAYRYSTSGFLDLTDAAIARTYAQRGRDTFAYQPARTPTINGVPIHGPLTGAQRAALNGTQATDTFVPRGLLHQRSRFTLSLNQPLGGRGGTLYGNVSMRDYWNRNRRDTTFQVGYHNHFHRLSYGISAARTRDLSGRFDNRIYVNFSLPLGDTPSAPTFAANLQHDTQGDTREQAMLNGSLGRYSQFNWGATASHANRGGNAASVHAGYHGPYAVLDASYGKGAGYSQASFGMSGSVLAHAGGVTFGQPTGNTVAIVHAPGAAGAEVQNAPGVHLNRHGYAIVPYLMPFQLDTIRINPEGLPLGVQLDATSASVAPYAGAIVMVNFKTHYGRALIARIHQANGKPVPFGAQVTDAQGQSVGIVGQAGLALLRVARPSGRLSVQWEGQTMQSCAFAYVIPAPTGPSGHTPNIDASCAVSELTMAQRHGDGQ